mmetsp:Transcript_10006/g.15116  ORF Transcript_10006/g.15116 Transcript_10006/m.15116 type:complete len:273 (-) Transcript_10006:45-863(-)
MGKFIQIVIGPAGTGKSTYCKNIQEHCKAIKRTMHVANLDPAAECFEYEPLFDIRELISLEDAMEELNFGPNGGLVYCMEYLLQNSDWLQDELENIGEDEYLILDCPGQIELYSHLPIMHNLIRQMEMWGYRMVVVYLLDALFVLEPEKFISGCMLSLSCMIQLGLPHVNVVTKCDIADKEALQEVLESESASWIMNRMTLSGNGKLQNLTRAIGSVVDDYMMVGFVTMDISDEDSMNAVLLHTDHAVQFGEDVEPKDVVDADEEWNVDQNI